MTVTPFLHRCRSLAAAFESPGDTASEFGPPASDAESLIGFFQMFRPQGQSLEGLFDDFSIGDQLSERLQRVFAVAGEDRRPGGGRDAYFIVRSSPPLEPGLAEQHGHQWITGLSQIAAAVGDQQVTEILATAPKIRVLEGIPPKHPKQPSERSALLHVIADRASKLTEQVAGVDPHAELLRQAYYFMACDAMLRDYLMWPFYAQQTDLADPLESYFELWKHGVKYRIFGEDQIDLYLPRQPPG